MSELKEWLESSDENRRAFAQENLILQVTEAIWEALEKRGWSKKELADALHVSKSHVTQMLNGSRNMTLRTLSDIAFSLGLQMKLRICDADEARAWDAWESSVAKNVFAANQRQLIGRGLWDIQISRGTHTITHAERTDISASKDVIVGTARTDYFGVLNTERHGVVRHG